MNHRPTDPAHERARWRRRRIIMNNDGHEFAKKAVPDPITPTAFLAERTSDLEDSQVDSIFYCDGVFNRYTHRSTVSETLSRKPAGPNDDGAFLFPWVDALHALDTDPLELICTWCREHDREVFWSMRMNDQHDSYPHRRSLVSRWKLEHPSYLMGRDGFPRDGGMNLLDYGQATVRAQVESIVVDVVSRYDIDGVDLDFLRHPCFFRNQMEGRDADDAQRHVMTDLLRRLRGALNTIARQRGRPLLLAARIPDDCGFSQALGLDPERWVTEGLVDLLTAGDYFKLRPWSDWATFGRRHEIPVYACLDGRRIMGGGRPLDATDLPRWRGEALRAWRAGVNGITTFNRFDPHDPIFRELGDPERLAELPHVDQESYATADGSRLDPDYWLHNGRRFLKNIMTASTAAGS